MVSSAAQPLSKLWVKKDEDALLSNSKPHPNKYLIPIHVSIHLASTSNYQAGKTVDGYKIICMCRLNSALKNFSCWGIEELKKLQSKGCFQGIVF